MVWCIQASLIFYQVNIFDNDFSLCKNSRGIHADLGNNHAVFTRNSRRNSRAPKLEKLKMFHSNFVLVRAR